MKKTFNALLVLTALGLVTLPQAQAGKTYVTCGVDESGDNCVVDLISECRERTACSAAFSGHGVYDVSHSGLIPIRAKKGVAGDEIEEGVQFPFNNEVCTDTEITRVYYQPAEANWRWTRVKMEGDTAVLTGRIEAGDDVPTRFPYLPGQKLNARCVRIEAPEPSETQYSILSVRVAAKLEENRQRNMHKLMVQASVALAQGLENVEKEVVKKRNQFADPTKNPELSKIVPTMDAYIRILKEGDKSFAKIKFLGITFSESRTPVTNPSVIRNMRSAYAFGRYLLAQLQKDPIGAHDLIRILGNFCAELNHGFGINEFDQQEATAPVTGEAPEVADLTRFRTELPDVIKKATPFTIRGRYHKVVVDYVTSLQTLQSSLSGKDSLTGLAEQDSWNAYYQCKTVGDKIPLLDSDGNEAGIATFVRIVNHFCETIKTTFKVPVQGESVEAARNLLTQGLGILDSHKKLDQLFGTLLTGVGLALKYPGATWSWDDARYKAARHVEHLIGNLAPSASQQLDSAIIGEMGPIIERWNSPEFHEFLEQIQSSAQSNDQASDAEMFIEGAVRSINAVLAENGNQTQALIIPTGFQSPGGLLGSK